jgi:uncharacterized protein involved in exopolysaccharide biosynthesis
MPVEDDMNHIPRPGTEARRHRDAREGLAVRQADRAELQQQLADLQSQLEAARRRCRCGAFIQVPDKPPQP